MICLVATKTAPSDEIRFGATSNTREAFGHIGASPLSRAAIAEGRFPSVHRKRESDSEKRDAAGLAEMKSAEFVS
jgi:hypothetical protein